MGLRHVILIAALQPFVSAQAAEEAPLVEASELSSNINKLVSVRGIVIDAIPDERDPHYAFLLLQSAMHPVYVATRRSSLPPTPAFKDLVNAEIIVTGICRPANNTSQPRRYLGQIIDVTRRTGGSIRLIKPAGDDLFQAPDVDAYTNLCPTQVQQLGRRRIRGKVLAAWGRAHALIRTPSALLSHIELATEALPPVDTHIEAVGFVDTDVYRLNLTRAVWRQTGAWPTTNETVIATTACAIMTDGKGNPHIDTEIYGRLVELEGLVLTLSGNGNDRGILIENTGYTVPIDASACRSVLDDLTVGCRVKATGICLLDIENYRLNNMFPRVRGFSLVLRRPADLTILSRPPWWNTRRLGGLLVVILGVTIVLFIWNRSLRILAERRGRQLADEQIQRTGTKLKVLERTRLSVDLHDALSQNLAGVTFALDAAKALTRDTGPVQRYLDIASKALLSCRTELRNCLWDLRNNALGNCSMDEAIRRSLIPIAGKAKIIIRFNVPREKLTDDMAHSVLRIVRELATNALRHGKASTIRIAGCLDGHLLRFTVHDDGTGFGPQPAPGPAEGHFGLQGIRERVRLFNGELTIDRDAAPGARVSVSLQLPEFDSPKESPR